MALTNFDIITLVNLIRNKDLEGEDITASEFQTLINAQSKLLFAEKLGVPNLYQLNAPIERRGVNVSRKIAGELRPFYVRETVLIVGGAADFSSKSIGYIDAIEPSSISGRGIDELFGDEVADRLGSAVVAPTADDPCMEWTSSGDSVLVYPSTITSIILKYYTFPPDAVVVLTTNATNLREEYDSVNSTELLWDDEQKIEIAYRILRDLGINMERQDVTAYAQNIVSNE